jgi:HlyD family secretion protein
MDHHHRHLLSFACLSSLFITMLTGCSHHGAAAYQGYVEGRFVYVASPQSGRLDRLSVNRGETISANQPLFTLDHEPESSAELQSRQILRSDESRLADLKTGKRPPEVDVVAAQLAQAKVEHQKSLDILKSDEAQYAAGGIPQTDLINARAAVASNAALVRQFQSDLDVAALPGRDEQMKAQAAVIVADRAALQQATWRLQQKQIASSMRGLVFDTLYQEGDWVSAGSPIIQMLPLANIEVRFFVPETIVGRLKLGQSISAHCDGCQGDVPAAISFISNQVEYTPPVIYSNENRAKLVFMIIARPALENAATLHPGQPVAVTLP